MASKGIDPDTASKIESQALRIFNEVECEHIGVVKFAQEGMCRITDAGCQIYIVTSRPTISEKPTRKWVRKHDIPFRKLLVSDEKSGRGQNWSFLVEDAPHHAEEAVKAGTRVCLLDYPWNQSLANHPLISRAKDWEEVVEFGISISQHPGPGNHNDATSI